MHAFIHHNLHQIQHKIASAEQQYGRDMGAVKLLAVSKGQTVACIIEAYKVGQRCFGENYLQEALSKQLALKDFAIEWHYIGHIQSNKTRLLAQHFAWIETLSNAHLARRLNEQRPLGLPPLNVCIQVNISEEPTKSGIMPHEVMTLATTIQQLPQLRLRGLMAIPAALNDFTAQRGQHQQLRDIFALLNQNGFALDTLSIGMSDDFEAAIAEGSTQVRIGTGIFGERHAN